MKFTVLLYAHVKAKLNCIFLSASSFCHAERRQAACVLCSWDVQYQICNGRLTWRVFVSIDSINGRFIFFEIEEMFQILGSFDLLVHFSVDVDVFSMLRRPFIVEVVDLRECFHTLDYDCELKESNLIILPNIHQSQR